MADIFNMLFCEEQDSFESTSGMLIKKAVPSAMTKIMAYGNAGSLCEFLSSSESRVISATECDGYIKSYNLYILNEKEPESVFSLSKPDENDIDAISSLIALMYFNTEGIRLDNTIFCEAARKNLENIYVLRNGCDICAMARVAAICGGYARINTVVVNEKYRGQGYAKAIVRAVSKMLTNKGFTPTVLADSLNHITNHIYPALGFEKTDKLYEYSGIACEGKINENTLRSGLFA